MTQSNQKTPLYCLKDKISGCNHVKKAPHRIGVCKRNAMSLIFKLFLSGLISAILAFSAVATAAVRCEILFKPRNTLLQEKASAIKFDEFKYFVLAEKILSVTEFRRLEEKILPFDLSSKDMGNAMFFAVLDFISAKPSPKLDLLVNKFLRPVFIKYLNEFETFIRTEAGKKPTIINGLFGLEKLIWSPKTAEEFVEKLYSEYFRNKNFNLRAANQLLVQLTYIHTVLNLDQKMTLAELEQASEGFLNSVATGHVFIPAVGMWDIANINAQWFLGTTVNMMPPSLNHKIDVHGGLSSLDGLAHDHGHYYQVRLASTARLLKTEIKNLPANEKFDRKLHELLLATLTQIRNEASTEISGTVLTNTIFFFIHQPEALELFMNKLKDRRLNWGPNSIESAAMARFMREQLEIHQNFFPNLGKDFATFERTAKYWISALGQQATKDDFQSYLPSSP